MTKDIKFTKFINSTIQATDYMNIPDKIIFKNKEYHCPVEVVIDLISGKWKSETMWLIQDEPKRFGEIKRLLNGISPKVLTEQLRELEENGLIIRESYPEIPPRVQYSLSEQGRSLWPILEQMYDWGINYLESNSNQKCRQKDDEQIT